MENFDKFIRILDLEGKIIRIRVSNTDYTFITYYKKNDVYTIYIRLNAHRFEPIHELGHIFLAEKTKYIYFGGRESVYIDSVYENLMNYVNELLDCFVNYHISRFDDIYPIWVDYFNEIYGWAHGKIIEPPDYINEVLIVYYIFMSILSLMRKIKILLLKRQIFYRKYRFLYEINSNDFQLALMMFIVN